MEARYLRVKKWRDHQHYSDREPPWIKVARKLLADDKFRDLTEFEQWQLVRIWIIATDSSRFTLDDRGRPCPVVADDEQTLRRAIGTLKKVPLAKFIRDGWLIPVAEDELLPPDSDLLPRKHGASTGASTGIAPSIGTEVQRLERRPGALPIASYDKPSNKPLSIKDTITQSLKEAS